MPQTINVLFLAAEAEPFVKVGGLGDVAGTLPRALRALSSDELIVDVRLVLPLHTVVKQEGLKPLGIFSIPRGRSEVQAEAFEGTLDGMPVYFINGDPIRASGTVYSSNNKMDAEKYVFFSLAALELPSLLHWTPNLFHANDWHTALTAYGNLVRRWEDKTNRIASLITIHNLPFLGPDVKEILASYELPLANTDLPEWARVLPMPLGLWASDAMVAVSPTYAEEILHEEFGSGLHEFFRNRTDSLYGILNGLDTASYDPQTDPFIPSRFHADDLSARQPNKAALQEKLGLPVLADVPLLGMVSRMDEAKGIDIALQGLRMLSKQKWQLVILGAGNPKLEDQAKKLQETLPDRVRVETRFDAKLARHIYAGSDIFLMPSRYEPCGISQMIAMRYGSVPLVRAVGGLHDTVTDSETGFVFVDKKIKSFNDTLKRALQVYSDRARWENIQKAGMRQDFSWTRSAQKYLDLYKRLIETAAAPSSEAYARRTERASRIREEKPVIGGAK
ncbi:MAG: glycogen synthase [Chloroflexota bacterium]|nr:glycogen synthase [Chloroflexota bacterium]MBI5703928.1 glycogen synthase [Chloroflexota bacterium]